MVSGALIFVTTGAASEITIFLFTAAMLIANGEAAVTALVVSGNTVPARTPLGSFSLAKTL